MACPTSGTIRVEGFNDHWLFEKMGEAIARLKTGSSTSATPGWTPDR